MFPPELERDAFRADNEFGWTRAQIPMVVDVLRHKGLAILGRELWWESDGSIYGTIPQRHGLRDVDPWVTERRPDESWLDFVEPGANDTLAAVEKFPAPGDLPAEISGRILYNLNWVSESEFEKLVSRVL
jgi:hypothetical protein